MITDRSWPLARVAAGLYVLQRSTQASITSGKRFRYENTSRLRWLPPVQTLPGLPEGGGVAVGVEPGNKDQGTWDSGRGRGDSLDQGGLIVTLLGLIESMWQVLNRHIISFSVCWRCLSVLHHLINWLKALTGTQK